MLDQKLLNCDLDRVDLTLQLLRFARNHACRDDGPRDITSTAKSCFGWHKYVWNVLSTSQTEIIMRCRNNPPSPHTGEGGGAEFREALCQQSGQ